MLQRLSKIEMCWKWQQGIIVDIFKHVTHTHTNNTGQITLSVDAGGMMVREKAEMKIEIIS